VSPSHDPKGTDIAQSAPGALAATPAKATIDASVAAGIANSAAIAGSSTTAAIPGIRGAKSAKQTAKSDSSAADATQAAPSVDPSSSQSIPLMPQPIAAVISAPIIPASPALDGSSNASGSGQGAAPIAALTDAVKAGGLRQADPAATSDGGSATSGGADQAGSNQAGSGLAGTDQAGNGQAGNDQTGTDQAGNGQADSAQAGQADDGTRAGATAADAVTSALALATGSSLPNAADAVLSRNAGGVPAAAAAANRARERAATNQPTDGSVGSQDNSNGLSNGNATIDPNAVSKRDPAASASQIEDIARQALAATTPHGETATVETAIGGTSHSDGAQAGGVAPSPDGSASLSVPASPTTSAAAPTAATTATPIPIAGLAVEIASHARAGNNRFDIRLDPPELGRVDVRLDVDRDGKVTSHLVVDRPETLDMLRRDAPQLERSLQQAGLKTADNALQFSLRDQGGFGGQNPNPNYGSQPNATRVVIPDRNLPPVETTTAAYSRPIGARAGIDIRV
jgi:flagellar hook-length control protein FliK